MSRRTERVASLIRRTIGQILLTKISDPRIDSARTSVTRVEVPEDLLTARVYVSVLGSEGQQKRAIEALRHAAGHIQELMMEQIQLRNTPVLSFTLDVNFKKTLQTLAAIDQAMQEIRRKDADRESTGGQSDTASEDGDEGQGQNRETDG